MKLIRSWLGCLLGTIPFFATVKNWAVKFNQDKDSTEDNPRQEFKTSTSKEEAVAFIVWLRMKDSYYV